MRKPESIVLMKVIDCFNGQDEKWRIYWANIPKEYIVRGVLRKSVPLFQNLTKNGKWNGNARINYIAESRRQAIQFIKSKWKVLQTLPEGYFKVKIDAVH